MAPQPDLLKNLETLRQQDKKGEYGFSTIRMETFLKDRGLTGDRFAREFDAGVLKEMLGDFKSKGKISGGEEQLLNTLTSVAGRVREDRLRDVLQQGRLMTKDQFRELLHKQLEQALVTDTALMHDLDYLHEGYTTIYDLCERHLQATKGLGEFRDTLRIEAGESLEKGLAKTTETIRGNWGRMSGKEKAVAVIGVIVGAIFLSKAKSEKVQTIKDYLWTGAKWLGIAFAANIIAKIFFGQRALEMFSNWAKQTSVNAEWFEKLLGLQNDPKGKEKTEHAQMALAALGAKSLKEILDTYEAAKKNKIYGVVFPDVNETQFPPDKLYMGLDAIFSRFKPERLKERYGTDNPLFSAAISSEMAEEDLIDLKPSIPQRIVRGGIRAGEWVFDTTVAAGTWALGMSEKGVQYLQTQYDERWGYRAQEERELGTMVPKDLLPNAEVKVLNENIVVIAGVPLECPWSRRKDGPPVTYLIEGKELTSGRQRDLADLIKGKVDALLKAKTLTGYTLEWNGAKRNWLLKNYPLIPAIPGLGLAPENRDVYLQIEPGPKPAELVLLFKSTPEMTGVEDLNKLPDISAEEVLRKHLTLALPAFRGERIVFSTDLSAMQAAGKITGRVTEAEVPFELGYDPVAKSYSFIAGFDVTKFTKDFLEAKKKSVAWRIEGRLAKLRALIDQVPEEWLDHWPSFFKLHFTHLFGGSVSEGKFKSTTFQKKDELVEWYQDLLAKYLTTHGKTLDAVGKFEEEHMHKLGEKIDALTAELGKHIKEKRPTPHVLFETWLTDLDTLMYQPAFRTEINAFHQYLGTYLIEEEKSREFVAQQFRKRVLTVANDPAHIDTSGEFKPKMRDYLDYVQSEIFTILEDATPPISAKFLGENAHRFNAILDYNAYLRRTVTFDQVKKEKYRYFQRELDLVFVEVDRVATEAIEADLFKDSVVEAEWRASIGFRKRRLEDWLVTMLPTITTSTQLDTMKAAVKREVTERFKTLAARFRAESVRQKIDRDTFERWIEDNLDVEGYGAVYAVEVKNFRRLLFAQNQFTLFPKQYFLLGRINYQPAIAYGVLQMFVAKTKEAGKVLDDPAKPAADKERAKKYIAYATQKFQVALNDAKDRTFLGFWEKLKQFPDSFSQSTFHSEQVTKEFVKMHQPEFDAVPDFLTGPWEKDIEKTERRNQLQQRIETACNDFKAKINAYQAKAGQGLKNPEDALLTDEQFGQLVTLPDQAARRKAKVDVYMAWEKTGKIAGRPASFDQALQATVKTYTDKLAKMWVAIESSIDANADAAEKT